MVRAYTEIMNGNLRAKCRELEGIIANGPRDHARVYRAQVALVQGIRAGDFERAAREALAALGLELKELKVIQPCHSADGTCCFFDAKSVLGAGFCEFWQSCVKQDGSDFCSRREVQP